MKLNYVSQLITVALALLLVCSSGMADETQFAEGFIVVQPVSERSCVALRVDVPVNQAVSGIRWFNGSASQGFVKVLLASGEDIIPPVYSEAIELGSNITGNENAWSEMTFTEPVASLTEALFVILQYPPNYVSVEGESPVGVGYVEQSVEANYFVSIDGNNWRKVSRSWSLLIEPVYVARTPGMTAKSLNPPGEPSPEAIPKDFGLRVYPNPFNPETTLELSLPRRTEVSVKVFDLRGMLVRTLFEGELVAGVKTLRWDGRTNQGQGASSGVYYALVQAGERSLTNRLVLIK